MSEVRIGWAANPEGDIAFYRAYWGLAAAAYDSPGSPKDMGNNLIGAFDILESGIYHIAVTAINTGGLESGFSTEVVRFIALGVGLGKAN
jgi:hypothetical protein